MAGGYPELVAPLIPDAQKNQSAQIALEAMKTGLASAAQFAQMKRNSEMDMLQLAARERTANDQLALDKDKLEQDFDLRDRQIKVQQSYYDNLTATRNTGINFNLQRQALLAEVNDSAEKLKLNDPEFQTKQPIRFAQGVRDFEDMWRLSPLPEVKHAIKQYKSVAEEQKIPVKMGMRKDDEGNWIGGEVQNVPILQIVKNLKDPATRAKTEEILVANGLMQVPKELKAMSGKWIGGLNKDKLKATEITDPRLNQAIEQSAGMDTTRKPSRVPTTMLPKSAGKGTDPTELPEPEVDEPQASNSQEPVFEPTQSDQMLFNAKAAIAKGAPIAAVAQRFQELGGDPSQLMS